MKSEIKPALKQWEKPELIVLTRSKPEEAVLHGCKLASGAITMPSSAKSGNYKCWRNGCTVMCPTVMGS
jgi:hypothetical protein